MVRQAVMTREQSPLERLEELMRMPRKTDRSQRQAVLVARAIMATGAHEIVGSRVRDIQLTIERERVTEMTPGVFIVEADRENRYKPNTPDGAKLISVDPDVLPEPECIDMVRELSILQRGHHQRGAIGRRGVRFAELQDRAELVASAVMVAEAINDGAVFWPESGDSHAELTQRIIEYATQG